MTIVALSSDGPICCKRGRPARARSERSGRPGAAEDAGCEMRSRLCVRAPGRRAARRRRRDGHGGVARGSLAGARERVERAALAAAALACLLPRRPAARRRRRRAVPSRSSRSTTGGVKAPRAVGRSRLLARVPAGGGALLVATDAWLHALAATPASRPRQRARRVAGVWHRAGRRSRRLRSVFAGLEVDGSLRRACRFARRRMARPSMRRC